MRGWICIHRKLKSKGFYRNSQYVHLWLHLLVSANSKPKEFLWSGKTIVLKPGQFITGRTSLVSETGIPKSTIERALDLFEREGQIGQQKTNKYRLITILKWGNYQQERATGGQLAGTNNNNNKVNNREAKFPNTEIRPSKDMYQYDENNPDGDNLEIDPVTGFSKPKAKRVKDTALQDISKELWASYLEGYKANIGGIPPNFDGPRYYVQLKKALKEYTLDQLKQMLPTFFNTDKPYTRENKWALWVFLSLKVLTNLRD